MSASSVGRFVGIRFGAGIRANCENSSTSPFSDSTSPTIVFVHSSTSARVAGGADWKCRARRSAHSWIGVRGFLTSWARRRATSRHAATFWARMSGVMSSKTSTVPFARAAFAVQPRGRGGQVQFAAVDAPARSPAPAAPRRRVARLRSARRAAPGPARPSRSATGRPAPPSPSPSSRAAALLIVVTRPPASTDTTPVVIRSSTVSMYRRRASASWCCRCRSRVDRSRSCRLCDSSPAMALNASTSDPNSSDVSGSSRWSRCPAPMSRAAAASIWIGRVIRLARYSPVQVAADEDHQRHHQEERDVDAEHRSLRAPSACCTARRRRSSAATARPCSPVR